MLNIDGFRLVQAGDSPSYYVVSVANVKYEEVVKYQVERQSTIDPTYIYRSGEYHEDKVTVDAVLDASDYDDFLTFCKKDNLYIEFDLGDGVKQLPVVIDKYPAIDNKIRTLKGIYTLEFVSRYENLEDYDFDFTCKGVPSEHEIAF